MINKVLTIAMLVATSLTITGCNEEMEFASLEGQWAATKADFTFGLMPVHKDVANLQVTFGKDGTVLITENANQYAGKYSVKNDRLTLEDISIPDWPIVVAGRYDIKILTDTQLSLYAERQAVYADSTKGTLSGTVKVTLGFSRPLN